MKRPHNHAANTAWAVGIAVVVNLIAFGGILSVVWVFG